MKNIIALGMMFMAGVSLASGVPGTITYQGTLKEKGVPANGSRTMNFQITNANGSTVYWTSGDLNINVTQGLFTAVLSPTLQAGQNWQNITPYLQVSVNGQALSPREPINANIYAFMSGDIVDGAITTLKLADGAVTAAKLDSSVQKSVTPPGIIVAYGGSNPPSGWQLCDGSAISRANYANLFAAIGTTWGGGDGSTTFNVPDLRGRTLFDKAASGTFASMGTTGGSETHGHQLNTTPTSNTGNYNFTVTVGAGGKLGAAQAGPDFPSTGATINTNSVSNVPPYAVVNYIIKT